MAMLIVLNVTFVSQSSNDSVDSSGRFSQHSGLYRAVLI